MMINNIDNQVSEQVTKFMLQPLSPDGYLRRHDVVMFEVLFENLLDVYFYV